MAYLKWLFRGLCVLLSVCATIYPIHIFNLNEDALEIELKDLHSSNDALYPGIRLCLAHAILHGYATPSRSTLSTENSMQDGPDPAKSQIDDYIRNIEIIHRNKTHCYQQVMIQKESFYQKLISEILIFPCCTVLQQPVTNFANSAV